MFTTLCSSAWGREWRVFHPGHFDGAVPCFQGSLWECCQWVRFATWGDDPPA